MTTFVGAVEAPLRPALLRELVALDVDYRRRAGETPGPGDYTALFPEHADAVADAFGAEEAAAPPPARMPAWVAKRLAEEARQCLRAGLEELPTMERSGTFDGAADGSQSATLPYALNGRDRPSFGGGAAAPATLGDYDLHARIGQGGMGVVYRAFHRPSGRTVALNRPPAVPGRRAGRDAAPGDG